MAWLSRIKHGWTAIFALVFAISVLTFGYTIGFEAATDQAKAVAEGLDAEVCRQEYGADAVAVAKQAVACTKAIRENRMRLLELRLPFWLQFGSLIVAAGTMVLIVSEVIPRFAPQNGTQRPSDGLDQEDDAKT